MIMKKEKKMTWYDVTLNQFDRLQESFKIEDETERIITIAEILLGDEVTNLPLPEFNKQVKQLDFLKDEIPTKNHPPKNFEINGRKYTMDCLLGNVSTAQYVDYTNHCKVDNPDMAKMLSVFIIPEGHKYNDGYDMLQVMNDINSLPIPIVNSTAFFFGKQFSKFMRIFQRYSTKQIKKTDLPKAEKNRLIEIVKNSVDLVLYPLS